jgi:uncharacterized protein (UPF0264 family)
LCLDNVEGPYWWSALAFLKYGLSRCPWWREGLLAVCERLASPRMPQVVAVAYADWHRADAPRPEEVFSFAAGHGMRAFLVDTFTKAPGPDGWRPTLLDFLSVREAVLLCQLCRAAGVRVALAGSLGPAEIERLLPAAPDWFAVRGAACAGGERGGRIDEGRVRDLAALAARAP